MEGNELLTTANYSPILLSLGWPLVLPPALLWVLVVQMVVLPSNGEVIAEFVSLRILPTLFQQLKSIQHPGMV